MPALALPATSLLITGLVARSPQQQAAANSSSSTLLPANSPFNATTNTTANALQVVCAWPVSGQYGPGSRVLYYVLVAACVVARKSELLRNACLAAALLVPTVAALHGIVLAAVHVDGAVDMDVYGAFQFCSIGILAAPVAARISTTYFNDPRRNTIFVWTGIILSGLLSLTVEFYRSTTSDCPSDESGHPIDPKDIRGFLNRKTKCGLPCDPDTGPFSPMRGGSANNIYVIPAPNKFSFGTATLLAAACCVPAILSLITMWFKIVEEKFKKRRAENDLNDYDDDDSIDTSSDRSHSATTGKRRVIRIIRKVLGDLEIAINSGAILTILFIGELNFFSLQVDYMTEPIKSIGQWAPIVGTGLAVFASLSLFLAAGLKDVENEPDTTGAPMHYCNCLDCPHRNQQLLASAHSPSSREHRSMDEYALESPTSDTMGHPEMDELGIPLSEALHTTTGADGTSTGGFMTTTRSMLQQDQQAERIKTAYVGARRKLANGLISFGNKLSTAGHDHNKEFRQKARQFPVVPAESSRNPDLSDTIREYNRRVSLERGAMALRRQRSRGASFTGSDASGNAGEGASRPPRAVSPQSPRSSLRSPSPMGSPPLLQRIPHTDTLPAGRASSDSQDLPASPGPYVARHPTRRTTLTVPPRVDHGAARTHARTTSAPVVSTAAENQSPPTIVVSPDPGPDTSAHAREET